MTLFLKSSIRLYSGVRAWAEATSQFIRSAQSLVCRKLIHHKAVDDTSGSGDLVRLSIFSAAFSVLIKAKAVMALRRSAAST